MDKIERLANWLRESDPEGCEDGWDYKPQAVALLKLASDAGFVIVPKVPSEAMLEKGTNGLSFNGVDGACPEDARYCYTAMIAAGEGE